MWRVQWSKVQTWFCRVKRYLRSVTPPQSTWGGAESCETWIQSPIVVRIVLFIGWTLNSIVEFARYTIWQYLFVFQLPNDTVDIYDFSSFFLSLFLSLPESQILSGYPLSFYRFFIFPPQKFVCLFSKSVMRVVGTFHALIIVVPTATENKVTVKVCQSVQQLQVSRFFWCSMPCLLSWPLLLLRFLIFQ